MVGGTIFDSRAIRLAKMKIQSAMRFRFVLPLPRFVLHPLALGLTVNEWAVSMRSCFSIALKSYSQ